MNVEAYVRTDCCYACHMYIFVNECVLGLYVSPQIHMSITLLSIFRYSEGI